MNRLVRLLLTYKVLVLCCWGKVATAKKSLRHANKNDSNEDQTERRKLTFLNDVDVTIKCRPYLVATEIGRGQNGEDQTEFTKVCLTDSSQEIDHYNGMTYVINGMEDVSLSKSSGKIEVSISHCNRFRDDEDSTRSNTINVTSSSTVTLSPLAISERRHLSPSSGTSNVLVVRVNAPDGSPFYGTREISDHWFGTNGDTNNLGTRYRDCSFGKLNMVPGSGRDVTNGVTEVTINTNVKGADRFSVADEVTRALERKMGFGVMNSYRQVVFILPEGSLRNGNERWFAYAFVGGNLAVYNDKTGSYVSNQIHEVGHNLGLLHSAHGTSSYGDQSGLMGFGYSSLSFPKMCFNGAKYYQLGWMNDKMANIQNKAPAVYHLAAFVDYRAINTRNSQYTLMKHGNFYILYNLRKGMNQDSQEFEDTVTITELTGFDEKSFHRAALNEGGKYSFPNGETFEFCDRGSSGSVDYVKVVVYRGSSTCATAQLTGRSNDTPNPIPAPTPAPTPPPVPSPTPQPTPAPTPRPSPDPTPLPTPRPTNPLTPGPTNRPTRNPTRNPTRPPTPLPTRPPSPGPTSRPTTGFPSLSPTPVPTKRPTHDTCDDSLSLTFFVESTGKNEGCLWLRDPSRASERNILCNPSHPSNAYNICEETCEKCTDTCENSPGTFTFKGNERDCSWLDLRVFYYDDLCVEGQTAYTLCRETCNNCLAPPPSFSSPTDPPVLSLTGRSDPGESDFSRGGFFFNPRRPGSVAEADNTSDGEAKSVESLPVEEETQTAATPTSATCNENDINFELELKTDRYPEETSWELRAVGISSPAYMSPRYSEKEAKHLYQYCLDSSHEWVLQLFDSGRDGLSPGGAKGDGYFIVRVDGSDYDVGGVFPAEEEVYIKKPCQGDKFANFIFQVTTDATASIKLMLSTTPDSLWRLDQEAGPYNSNSKEYVTDCFPLTGSCYNVTVVDMNGNGFAEDSGASYEVNFNGRNVADSMMTTGVETVLFGDNCPENAENSSDSLRRRQ